MLDTTKALLDKIRLGEDSFLDDEQVVPRATMDDLVPALWERPVPSDDTLV